MAIMRMLDHVMVPGARTDIVMAHIQMLFLIGVDAVHAAGSQGTTERGCCPRFVLVWIGSYVLESGSGLVWPSAQLFRHASRSSAGKARKLCTMPALGVASRLLG